MAGSKSPSSAMTEMYKQMREFTALNPMLGPQMAHFWEAQEDILNETETFARHWFERRHVAARTALAAARDMAQNGPTDPASSVQAVSDWQSRSMERIAEDFREWFEMCSNCTSHLAREEMEAGEEGLTKAAKTAKSATSKKEATPV